MIKYAKMPFLSSAFGGLFYLIDVVLPSESATRVPVKPD